MPGCALQGFHGIGRFRPSSVRGAKVRSLRAQDASPTLRLHTACDIVPAAGNHSFWTLVALPDAQNKKQVAFRTPQTANHSFTHSVHLQYDVTVRMQSGARR